jgi:hypothetical protein
MFNFRRKKESYLDRYNTEKPDISDYITNRFETQLNWYHNKATDSRIIFYVCQGLIIVFGAMVPIINVAGPDVDSLSIRITSSILGALITIIAGFIQLLKAQESWILFRSTAENLKLEYHLFMQRSREYSDPNLSEQETNKLFIDRAESIMSAEGLRYSSLRQNVSKQPDGKVA